MRHVFIRKLVEIAQKDPRIVLLTADLGFGVLDCFREKFPDRFFNIGVAEQNMAGIACGLAREGMIPFIYSMVPFVLLRAYEFLKVGAILHHLPVRIIGVGGGMEYAFNGITHFGLEDFALTRVQPGLTSVIPADRRQAELSLEKTFDLPRPVYFRISKMSYENLIPQEQPFALGKANLIGQGRDVLLITAGYMTLEAIRTSTLLAQKSIGATVLVVSSFNPSPVDCIKNKLEQFPAIAVLEDHYLQGGLGSLVSEITTDHHLNKKIIRIGVEQMPRGIYSSTEVLYDSYGLSAEKIIRKLNIT